MTRTESPPVYEQFTQTVECAVKLFKAMDMRTQLEALSHIRVAVTQLESLLTSIYRLQITRPKSISSDPDRTTRTSQGHPKNRKRDARRGSVPNRPVSKSSTEESKHDSTGQSQRESVPSESSKICKVAVSTSRVKVIPTDTGKGSVASEHGNKTDATISWVNSTNTKCSDPESQWEEENDEEDNYPSLDNNIISISNHKVVARVKKKAKADGMRSVRKPVCVICGLTFIYHSLLLRHIAVQHKELAIACKKCKRTFKSAVMLKFHLCRTKSEAVPPREGALLQCVICDDVFKKHADLREHVQRVHQVVLGTQRMYRCQLCEKTFVRPSELKAHFNIHTGKKPVSCTRCEVHFRSQRALSKHVQSWRHQQLAGQVEGSPILCAVCGKVYASKNSLYRHMRYHSSRRPYQCPHCTYRCCEVTNLKRHVQLHFKNQRHFMCEQCGTTFYTKRCLQDHVSYIHSDERLFPCKQCNKKFKTNNNLLRHLRTHSDAKPYSCEEDKCSSAFNRLSNLRRHYQKVHQKECTVRPSARLRLIDAPIGEEFAKGANKDKMAEDKRVKKKSRKVKNVQKTPPNELGIAAGDAEVVSEVVGRPSVLTPMLAARGDPLHAVPHAPISALHTATDSGIPATFTYPHVSGAEVGGAPVCLASTPQLLYSTVGENSTPLPAALGLQQHADIIKDSSHLQQYSLHDHTSSLLGMPDNCVYPCGSLPQPIPPMPMSLSDCKYFLPPHDLSNYSMAIGITNSVSMATSLASLFPPTQSAATDDTIATTADTIVTGGKLYSHCMETEQGGSPVLQGLSKNAPQSSGNGMNALPLLDQFQSQQSQQGCPVSLENVNSPNLIAMNSLLESGGYSQDLYTAMAGWPTLMHGNN